MIVDFNKYKKKRENFNMEKVVEYLKREGQNGNVFDSLEKIKLLTKIILQDISYYHYKSYTPIIRISEDLGIDIFSTNRLDESLSGLIYIGGTTKKIYGNDKIILVDKNEPLKHQWFVIAHEIAHYLLEYLTDPQYDDGNVLFADGYPKNKEERDSEKNENLADMFAAEILMPTELFIKQYNIAMKENNNKVFIVMYLSEYFKTKISSIEKRIIEVGI